MSTNLSTGLAIAGAFSLLYSFMVCAVWKAARGLTQHDVGVFKGAAVTGLLLGGAHILTAYITK